MIESVHARRVWDSRGRPTVETEIRLRDGSVGRAIAPAGASTGSGEAIDLRDGGSAFGGHDVQRALAAVNGEIAALLHGRDPSEQAGLDAALIALDGTPDKRRLGGNALVATSMRLRTRRPPRVANRSGSTLPKARVAPLPTASCPCPRSRSSGAARTPAGALTCRTSW